MSAITLSRVVTVSPESPSSGCVMLRGGGSEWKLACRSITKIYGKEALSGWVFTSECPYLNHIVCSFESYITEFYAPGWLLRVNVQSTILRFPFGAGKLFKYQFSGGLSRPQMWRDTAQLTSKIRLALFLFFWIPTLPYFSSLPITWKQWFQQHHCSFP